MMFTDLAAWQSLHEIGGMTHIEDPGDYDMKWREDRIYVCVTFRFIYKFYTDRWRKGVT
jgi:hypothetical protein